MLTLTRLALTLLAAALILLSSAQAETMSLVGQDKRSVLKHLGAPVEKLELEAKRESHWRYKKGRTLTFREEIVVADSTIKSVASDSPPTTVTESSKMAVADVRVEQQAIQQPTSKEPTEAKQPLPFTGRDVYQEFAKLESSDDPGTAPERPKSRPPMRSKGR